MQEFEIGDQVVYPNHGVGIIEKISNRLVQGKFQRFYLLRICSNDILVMVPTANANEVGLRRTIDWYLANRKAADLPKVFQAKEIHDSSQG